MKSLSRLLAALACAAATNAYAVGALVDVAVYDRAEGRELPVHYYQGKYYVVGKPGNEYQVVLRNRSGGDLLAVGSVDGVNVITGETANPSQSGYVLRPWQNMEIKGWRKSMQRTAAFYFTELDDSYAARTGRPGNVGVIGLAVFKRKEVPPPPPPAEISKQREPFASSGAGASADSAAKAAPAAPSVRSEARAEEKSLGTGHGRSESSDAQYTTFERASSSPDEVIAIYYDSYRNLVARGILRTPSRDPVPFPARFVPDPPRW